MAKGVYSSPGDFVEERGDGCEAVVVRIGLNGAQLVVVDNAGAWDRWVYHSVDAAKEVAASLGLDTHDGEYPEQLRVRMNAYRRTEESFEAAPYPEQGEVGPVIPYRENRPRRVAEAEAPKADEKAGRSGSAPDAET